MNEYKHVWNWSYWWNIYHWPAAVWFDVSSGATMPPKSASHASALLPQAHTTCPNDLGTNPYFLMNCLHFQILKFPRSSKASWQIVPEGCSQTIAQIRCRPVSGSTIWSKLQEISIMIPFLSFSSTKYCVHRASGANPIIEENVRSKNSSFHRLSLSHWLQRTIWILWRLDSARLARPNQWQESRKVCSCPLRLADRCETKEIDLSL